MTLPMRLRLEMRERIGAAVEKSLRSTLRMSICGFRQPLIPQAMITTLTASA